MSGSQGKPAVSEVAFGFTIKGGNVRIDILADPTVLGGLDLQEV